MSYNDRTLVCADCNAQFVFTVGEQEFHASKGLPTTAVPTPRSQTRRSSASVGSMLAVISTNRRRCGGISSMPWRQVARSITS